jgi:hypothetical protein
LYYSISGKIPVGKPERRCEETVGENSKEVQGIINRRQKQRIDKREEATHGKPRPDIELLRQKRGGGEEEKRVYK